MKRVGEERGEEKLTWAWDSAFIGVGVGRCGSQALFKMASFEVAAQTIRVYVRHLHYKNKSQVSGLKLQWTFKWIQASSYKMNKLWGSKGQHGDYCCIECLKYTARVSLNHFHHKAKMITLWEFPPWLTGKEPNKYPWEVGSILAPLSVLRIQHYSELWCRSQTRLVSHIAVAVMKARSWSSDWTTSLGTSIGPRCGPKKQEKKVTMWVNSCVN